MVYASDRSLSKMGTDAAGMESREKSIHWQNSFSLSLPGGTERSGSSGLPHDLAWKEAVYSGTYRSGKDVVYCISGSTGRGTGAGG